MMCISSVQNKFVKQINSLKTKKERDKTGFFVIEGERIVSEIPLDWKVEYYAVSEKYVSEFLDETIILEKYNRADILLFSDEIFKKVSDTVSPQGILAVCKQKEFLEEDILNRENGFFVILEEICDPGNLGTIIRTADAAGADGVFLSKGCVDLYNNKTIRSTMGSVFHVPIIRNIDIIDLTEKLKQNKILTLAAHLQGSKFPYDIDLKNSSAILIGNEANGLSEDVSKMADELVKIPMNGSAESMNASIAAGILIYEVVRQRIC